MSRADNIIIPRTRQFMNRLNVRMRFLMGEDVRLGETYSGWESVEGTMAQNAEDERWDGPCRALAYEDGCLYVFQEADGGVAVLEGDMADDHGRLIADRHIDQYDVPGLRRRVADYMARNRIAEYTSEVGRRALWLKYMDQATLAARVKVYEMTLGVM